MHWQTLLYVQSRCCVAPIRHSARIDRPSLQRPLLPLHSAASRALIRRSLAALGEGRACDCGTQVRPRLCVAAAAARRCAALVPRARRRAAPLHPPFRADSRTSLSTSRLSLSRTTVLRSGGAVTPTRVGHEGVPLICRRCKWESRVPAAAQVGGAAASRRAQICDFRATARPGRSGPRTAALLQWSTAAASNIVVVRASPLAAVCACACARACHSADRAYSAFVCFGMRRFFRSGLQTRLYRARPAAA